MPARLRAIDFKELAVVKTKAANDLAWTHYMRTARGSTPRVRTGTTRQTSYFQLMDTKMVKAAVDRTLATYTSLGLKGDEEYRQQLRESVTSHIERLNERGEHDPEQLVALTLRHLRSLETREASLRSGQKVPPL